MTDYELMGAALAEAEQAAALGEVRVVAVTWGGSDRVTSGSSTA